MSYIDKRSVLVKLVASIFLGFSCLILAQTSPSPKSAGNLEPTPTPPKFGDLWNAYHRDDEGIVITGPGNTYSMGVLRNDVRVSDVVAYVNVIERKLLDRTDETDCEGDKGEGYCAYKLTAKVIEAYKGKIPTPTIEFITTPDSSYPKRLLMGEKVVFLVQSDSEPGRKQTLGTIENSTRVIDYDLLAKMRRIVDANSRVDEDDEEEPYSRVSIRKQFDDADAVAYVDVVSYRQDKDDFLGTGAVLKARIIEVYKGDLRIGQTVEYRQNLLYRKSRAEDLGLQIVYLETINDNRYAHRYEIRLDKKTGQRTEKLIKQKETVRYESDKYLVGYIRHNILEKLREISATSKVK